MTTLKILTALAAVAVGVQWLYYKLSDLQRQKANKMYRASSSNNAGVWWSICAVNILVLVALLVWTIVCYVKFETYCGGHLKRAADANSVELAQKELSQALDYLNKNNITEGTTGVFFSFPHNDVGFWHTNLTTSLNELNQIHEHSPPTAGGSAEAQRLAEVARTNTLIKLRETLLDHSGQGGESITCPSMISIFPHNVTATLAAWGCLIVAVVSGIVGFSKS